MTTHELPYPSSGWCCCHTGLTKGPKLEIEHESYPGYITVLCGNCYGYIKFKPKTSHKRLTVEK